MVHILDDILNWYDTNQSTCIFSLASTPQKDQTLDALRLKELNYNGYDRIFNALPREKITILPEPITIEQVTENTLDDLFHLMGKNNWSVKKEFRQQNRIFYTRPDFLFYMAKVNDQPAAMGSIFFIKTWPGYIMIQLQIPLQTIYIYIDI
jgi:hypothetical protein